ncbi:MAG: hydroxymethylbilane synthase [Fretibacterium sp.]|nr:hydroxymethylbilane synthase [Fretibacterium sp.]
MSAGTLRKIRVGTRRSALAIAQTKLVLEAIRLVHPELELELVPMTTTGDVNMRPFSEAGDPLGIKGLFTLELEQALLKGDLDLAVHSLKDLPAQQDPRLPLVGFMKRGDPRDTLVLSKSSSAATGPIGCSSARRRLQLAALFPERAVAPIRGNVLTRLDKLDSGEFGMLVLAAAGLKRLGLEERIDRFFAPDELVPAAGQGVLACQGRAGDGENYSFLDALRDPDTEDCVRAERAFVLALGAGCSAPVGAYASCRGDTLELLGFYAETAPQKPGENFGQGRRGSIRGPRSSAELLGRELALRLKEEL